jgi:protein involved in polysaccharide export with SLBB domain
MRATLFSVMMSVTPALAGLETGDTVKISLRGVEAGEQQKIGGEYRVGESGSVSLPLLENPVTARGLNAEQLARAIEAAYRTEGIYTKPSIQAEVLKGPEVDPNEAIVSIGGQVRRAGESPFRKGMTVIQALDAAGGRNDFGGRNVMLLRGGKQYCLDFLKLKHKNIVLLPNDSLQVEPKGVIDRWKGTEESVKPLLEKEPPRLPTTSHPHRLADGREQQFDAAFGELAGRLFPVDDDGREGVVVDADDMLHTGPPGGEGGIGRTHGEIVTDAQHGEVERVKLAQQLHVGVQRGVAGNVEGSVRRLDDEAAGISAISAVRQHRRVDRIDRFHAAERKVEAAAEIHRVDLVDALGPVPRDDLEVRHQRGSGAAQDALGIRHVVLVAVGEQHVVGRDRIDIDGFREPVRRNEGVEKKAGAAGEFDADAGVTVVGELHRRPENRKARGDQEPP